MSDCFSEPLPPRFFIGRMGISVVTLPEAVQLLDRRVRRRLPAYVCAANVEATVLSQRDPAFCRIQNDSFLTLPDSMPLTWCATLGGQRNVRRVSGPDLMIEVLKVSVDRGYTHYFYGDTEGTLQRVRRVAQTRFPGIRILGVHSPPFRSLTDEEEQTVIDEMNRLRPSFIWVALGCPKQERWVARIFPRIQASIVIPVGAAFRFLIGEYRHAPRLLQVCGLEGIYWRGFTHPIQSAKWYSHHIPAFSSLLIAGLARRICPRDLKCASK
jgi:N-acetylglucosaminyldiphosphoundecaprenol N-acetyl-beta-D-mannosaminyltransferase